MTGNAAASDQKKSTNVTIEDEKLTIDLHQEFAAVEVRYRMKNTGGQVEQDFFSRSNAGRIRWRNLRPRDARPGRLRDQRGRHGIEIQNVDAKGEQPKPETDPSWGEFKAGTRLWKKSTIPFTQGQTREIGFVTGRRMPANQSSVSDDGHSSEAYFPLFALAGCDLERTDREGTVTVNYLHPYPEEISIAKPKDRFKKINGHPVRLGVSESQTDPGRRHEDRGPSGLRNHSGPRRIPGEL